MGYYDDGGAYNTPEGLPVYLPVTQPPQSLQTYGYLIHDTLFNVLSNDPYFANYTARRTKMLPVQTHQLPYVGVYFIDETEVPDGDPNCGDIRFSHTVRIGTSVIIATNDQDDAIKSLDQTYQFIMTRLWTDANITNVLATTNSGGVIIESLTRGLRKFNTGTAGAKNETPIMELQYDVSCFFRTMWDPVITDVLDQIVVNVGGEYGGY